MSPLQEFIKAAPAGFCPCEQPRSHQTYKYFVCGKGCTLGVLFEDSVNVYFEWLAEDGAFVAYPPSIRYKFWPKREVARLIRLGIWEVEGAAPVMA